MVTQGKKAISLVHGVLINQMMHFCVYAEVDLSGNTGSLAEIS